MAISGDYHTHTVYSHGKGTVEENVLRAVSLGLKEIGITDHGFRHGAFHVRRMDWPYMQAEVCHMKKKYPMINIYLGLETNLIHTDGSIDITEEDMASLDILICGYHKYVRTKAPGQFFKINVSNFIADSFGKTSQKLFIRNTDAYVNLITKNEIDIVSHPNNDFKSDITEVAKAAKHFGTFLELNGKRIDMTDRDIEKILEVGAKFIISSDAHSVSRIAEIAKPLSVIERVGIPPESIVNWDKLPEFRSRGAKKNMERRKK